MGDIKLSESTDPNLSPWLSTIYVKECERGQGIGSMIVRGLEQKAAGLGVKKLYLSAENTKEFYLKLGWTVRNESLFYGEKMTVMEKQLSSDERT